MRRHGDVEEEVPHPCAVEKSGRIPGEQRITAPHQITQARVSVPKRSVLITSVCENKSGVGATEEIGDSQASPLKGPTTFSGLMQTHSLCDPAQGQQLMGTSGI